MPENWLFLAASSAPRDATQTSMVICRCVPKKLLKTHETETRHSLYFMDSTVWFINILYLISLIYIIISLQYVYIYTYKYYHCISS